MEEIFDIRGPERAVFFLGIRLVGVSGENLTKLLLSILLVIAVTFLIRASHSLARRYFGERDFARARFWSRQGLQLVGAALLILGLASLWFDDPSRFATALGLISAGLAFALQKVVTAIAGYFVILRGRTFNAGDRIVMGGVRGDVIGLTFTQTIIMEMGQPPPVSTAEPPVWVNSRQYTGRVVSVSNAKIFDEPVYNYTSYFEYIWEEMILPVPYSADKERIEELLLEVARRHTAEISSLSEESLVELERRYAIRGSQLEPRVYWRLTENWLELTLRFVVEDHGIRAVKDAMSRDILKGLEEIGEEIASASFAIVSLPPLEILAEKNGKC